MLPYDSLDKRIVSSRGINRHFEVDFGDDE